MVAFLALLAASACDLPGRTRWRLWDYVRTPAGPLTWGYAARKLNAGRIRALDRPPERVVREVMGLCSNPCWIGGAVEHHSFASDGSAQIWQHTLTGAIELTLLIWSGPLPAQDSVLDDRNPATSTCGWFDQMNSACESPGLSVPARNGSNGRYPATPLSQAIVCPVRERIQFASRT